MDEIIDIDSSSSDEDCQMVNQDIFDENTVFINEEIVMTHADTGPTIRSYIMQENISMLDDVNQDSDSCKVTQENEDVHSDATIIMDVEDAEEFGVSNKQHMNELCDMEQDSDSGEVVDITPEGENDHTDELSNIESDSDFSESTKSTANSNTIAGDAEELRASTMQLVGFGHKNELSGIELNSDSGEVIDITQEEENDHSDATVNIDAEDAKELGVSIKQPTGLGHKTEFSNITQEIVFVESEDLASCSNDYSGPSCSHENTAADEPLAVEPRFETSSTLPPVTMGMIHNYYIKHYLPSRGPKAARKKRTCCIDSAIEYVQVCRQNDLVTVRSEVTPGQSDRTAGNTYSTIVIINMKEEEINLCKCLHCTNKEGCTHAIPVLYWLYRRTEEPVAEKEKPYWKKPKSNAANAQIFKPVASAEPTADLRELVKCFKSNTDVKITPDLFIDFCRNHITAELCEDIFSNIVEQSRPDLWHKLRFARITALQFYDVCNECFNGSVYGYESCAAIAYESEAIKRGKRLKRKVLRRVADLAGIVISPGGLQILPENPIFAAIPDGVSEDFCIQVKCPYSNTGTRNYVLNNNLKDRFLHQIMLQMYLCKKPKGLFCIASPNFENNKYIEIMEVTYDEHFLLPKLKQATLYWKKHIFPKLVYSVEQ